MSQRLNSSIVKSGLQAQISTKEIFSEFKRREIGVLPTPAFLEWLMVLTRSSDAIVWAEPPERGYLRLEESCTNASARGGCLAFQASPSFPNTGNLSPFRDPTVFTNYPNGVPRVIPWLFVPIHSLLYILVTAMLLHIFVLGASANLKGE
ncbi:hypothetical protein K402DRAFT_269135 [Aulographum hederae CBS 113979]|uniref:Uncharacterized protein n=1 Tax=Aulographum hederae CBS 113979 TaxID=1176131 RepID=A0A6G1H899_9PEZI|nr:hypothetical protein K402DRAFT_269135 [Aulographum hederae CBS 113979]